MTGDERQPRTLYLFSALLTQNTTMLMIPSENCRTNPHDARQNDGADKAVSVTNPFAKGSQPRGECEEYFSRNNA